MTALPKRGLYAITDCENPDYNAVLEKTEAILRAGAVLLQYRNNNHDIEAKIRLARELQILCHDFQCPLIINNDVELAQKIHADGVHLGKDDSDPFQKRDELGSLMIGVSCYNKIERAVAAQKSGADYVAFGSFYPSSTKPDAIQARPELIMAAKQQIDIPIVAIGGITPENGGTLIEAGADFLAVISGLYLSADPLQATQSYMRLFNFSD